MARFPDGARVCFVGDSITHANGFASHIVAYYRKNFPNSKIEFYNCGISGGNLGNSVSVYNEDTALYDPTHIVLMIGINDAGIGNFDREPSAERYAAFLKSFEWYKGNMQNFYELVSSRGVELILCTPAPYAEYQDDDSPVRRGAYALTVSYSEFVRNFAKEHSLALCDYNTAMTEVMQTEKLYAADRVHPNELGHYYMARTFLKSQGLELGEMEPFPEDLKEWRTAVSKLRNVIATEYFVVPGYFNMTDEERIAKVKERQDAVAAGTAVASDYLKSLMTAYFVNKPHQKELVDLVKKFMKNI